MTWLFVVCRWNSVCIALLITSYLSQMEALSREMPEQDTPLVAVRTSINMREEQYFAKPPLKWRHNGRDSVSNHQPHVCLLNRLSSRRSKKTSKPRFTGLCAGNSPGTGEFPAQMASYAENVSIWWRHHASAVSNHVLSEADKACILCTCTQGCVNKSTDLGILFNYNIQRNRQGGNRSLTDVGFLH